MSGITNKGDSIARLICLIMKTKNAIRLYLANSLQAIACEATPHVSQNHKWGFFRVGKADGGFETGGIAELFRGFKSAIQRRPREKRPFMLGEEAIRG